MESALGQERDGFMTKGRGGGRLRQRRGLYDLNT